MGNTESSNATPAGAGGAVLYVSYHGQDDVPSGDRNAARASANLDIIDAGGFAARNVLGPVTAPAGLKELRAVSFAPDGYLWVVSGSKSTSQILRFQATRGSHGSTPSLTSWRRSMRWPV